MQTYLDHFLPNVQGMGVCVCVCGGGGGGSRFNDCLIGLVVKASPLEWQTRGSIPVFAIDLFWVKLYR